MIWVRRVGQARRVALDEAGRVKLDEPEPGPFDQLVKHLLSRRLTTSVALDEPEPELFDQLVKRLTSWRLTTSVALDEPEPEALPHDAPWPPLPFWPLAICGLSRPAHTDCTRRT